MSFLKQKTFSGAEWARYRPRGYGKEACVSNRESEAARYVSEGMRREEKMRQMLEKYRAEMLGSKVVLLTGSTGSLGCFL